MSMYNSKEWETKNSSLAKIKGKDLTYKECRKYACEDIVKNLTHLPKELPPVLEIPKGTDFHFIGRIDTNGGPLHNSPEHYYSRFDLRKYVAFSIINRKNISRYKGKLFFIYKICKDDIVHIFPCDSNTCSSAKSIGALTEFPSLWLTLRDLEELTNCLGVYNQITCKTHRRKKIIKPVAILAIDKIDKYTKKIADKFGLSCIIIHPDEGAINYKKDLIFDSDRLEYVARMLKKSYQDIDIEDLLI